jgi:hypothetical protein
MTFDDFLLAPYQKIYALAEYFRNKLPMALRRAVF